MSCANTIEIQDCMIKCGGRPLFARPLCGSFSSGRINIVAGANGAGKSSLLDVLALRSALPPGASIKRSGHKKAGDIAYLPQVLTSVLDIKVQHLVDLAFCRGSARPAAPLEIEPALSHPRREVGQLSGGQQQILFFWLVASQPLNVFIYDEPLRHLDGHAEVFVREQIHQQIRDGKLVIVTSHSDGSRWEGPQHRVELS